MTTLEIKSKTIPAITVVGERYTDVKLIESAYIVTGAYEPIPALTAVTDTGEPLSTFTVNLEASGYRPLAGHIFLKAYSEGKGVYEQLKELGIVGEVRRTLDAGFAIDGVFEVPLHSDGWLVEQTIEVPGGPR